MSGDRRRISERGSMSLWSEASLLSCASLGPVMSFAEQGAVMGHRDWPRAAPSP